MQEKNVKMIRFASLIISGIAFAFNAVASLNSSETVVDVTTALKETRRPIALKAMTSLRSSASPINLQTNINATGDVEVYRQEGESIYLYFDVPAFAKRILSATVTLDAYDVDFPSATEHDKVYFNGYEVGHLVGGNQIWNANSFPIPVSAIQSGQNTMRIHVDVDVLGWVTMVRSVTLNLAFEKTDSFPSNVRAWQRERSNLVDVYYDLEVPSGELANISLSFNGLSSSPTASTVYGDIGSGVCSGTDKHIVWDAGKDWVDKEDDLVAIVYGSDSSMSDRFHVRTERFGVNDARCCYFDGELGKNGRHQTFLSGIKLEVSVTLSGGTESRPVSYYLLNGSRIEDEDTFRFNVGLLRPGEHLQVVAVDENGERSDPFVLNFDMASIPVLWPLHANEDPSRHRVMYTSLDFNTVTFGGGLEEALGLFDEELEFGFFPSFDVGYSVDSSKGEYREGMDVGLSLDKEEKGPWAGMMKKKVGRFAGADITASYSGGRAQSWDAQSQKWVDKSREYGAKLSADIQPINVRIPQTLYLVYFKMSFLLSGEFLFRNEMDVWYADMNFEPLVAIRPSLGVGVEGLVSGEVFGQLGAMAKFSVPEAPFVRELGVDGKVGVRGTVLGWESEHYYPWSWWLVRDQANMANARLMSAALPNQMADSADFHLIRRDYLDTGSKRIRLLMSPPSQGIDNPFVVVENGYPNPSPAIVADGARDCLVYLADDANRAAVNRTALMYREGVSNDWGSAVPILNDGTADFMPSLAKASSSATFVAWVNGNAVLDKSATMADQIKSLEIAVGVRDAQSGKWTCKNLTDDQTVDILPRVKTADNGKAVVVWIKNTANQLIGTKEAPSSLMASFYDGSGWSQPVAAASDMGTITSFDLAFDGLDCTIAVAKDVDGDVSTLEDAEILLIRGNETDWNAPCVVTGDAIPDERPSLWFDDDALNIAWIQGGKLVVGKVADDGKSVAGLNVFDSVSPSADFKVIPNGNSALLVWSNPAKENHLVSDLVCAEFESATRCVSSVSSFLATEAVERNFCGVIGSDGALRLAYESVEVSTNAAGEVQYGAVDLSVCRREAGVDVGIVPDGCSFANREPSYDDSDEVLVRVQNFGSTSVSGVCVRVYAGVGAESEDVTLNSPVVDLQPFSTCDVAVQCSISPSLSNLVFTVVADPQELLQDVDRSNNAVEWRPAIAAYGLSFESATADRIATNTWIIKAEVVNLGKATVPAGTPIRFWRGSIGGELLGERALGVLLPEGGQSGVSIRWGLGTANPTSAHERVWIEYGGEGFCPPLFVDLATSYDSDGDGVTDADGEASSCVPEWVEAEGTIGMKGGAVSFESYWIAGGEEAFEARVSSALEAVALGGADQQKGDFATNLVHTFSFANLSVEDWIEDYTIVVMQYSLDDIEEFVRAFWAGETNVPTLEWHAITITKEQVENGESLVFNQLNAGPVCVTIIAQAARNADMRSERTTTFVLDDVVTDAQGSLSEQKVRWVHSLTQSQTGYAWIKNGDGGLTLTGISDIWDVLDDDGGTMYVPNRIGGLPVTCIAQNAFANQKRLYSVVVPNSVTNIGQAAFTGCSSITNMVLPFVGGYRGGPQGGTSNLGYIFGLKAYSGGVPVLQHASAYDVYDNYLPHNFKSVTITDDSAIMDYAFSGCSNLTSVVLSNSVQSIGSRIFSGCSRLESITLPFVGKDRKTSPGYFTRYFDYSSSPSSSSEYVSSYVESYYRHFPKTLKKVIVNADSPLPESAFNGCLTLDTICINGDITVLPVRCFNSCRGLGAFMMPKSVTSIDDYAFYCCENLHDIRLPSGLKSIGSYAFYQAGLQNASIPSTITNIGNYAFTGCIGLVCVAIAEGARDVNIGISAFSGCSKLSIVSLPEGDAINIRNNAFYSCKSLDKVSIPAGVTNVGNSAFEGCSALREVKISSMVVGNNAFIRNKRLTDLTLAEGVKSIGQNAFYDCDGLIDLSIPSSVSKLGYQSFSYCDGLKTVELLAKDVEMGQYVFMGCSSLSSATISSRIIGTNAFSSCAKLSELILSEDLSEIGRQAFSGCVSLRTFALPSSLTKIEDYAFSGCQGLRAVSFPQNLIEIGSCAFNNCTALSTVSIPNGIEVIGSGAFSGCAIKSLLFNSENGSLLGELPKDSLKTLFLGEAAAGIDGELLSDCTTLETIMVAKANADYSVDEYGALYDKGKSKLIKYPCAASYVKFTAPSSLKSVDDGAFSYCNGLAEVSFPSSIMSIGDGAFDWCLGLQTVNFNGPVGLIGDGAFSVCPSLEELYFTGNSPRWGSNQFWYSTPIIYAESGTTGWDAAAKNVGFVVTYIGGSGTVVPNSWIDQYPAFLAAVGGDYEAAANSVGANGVTLRESYVAGLDPTNENSKFTAILTIENGEPKVTWSPDLSEDDTPRTYTIYGKATLSNDEEWNVVTDENKSAMHFFYVTVDLK